MPIKKTATKKAPVKKAAIKKKAAVRKPPAKKAATKKIENNQIQAAKKPAPVKKKTAVKKAAPVKKTPVKKAAVRKPQETGKRVNNGGARKGSGRKPGAATTKTREIADKLAEDAEVTPLEYMLSVLKETPEKYKAQYDAGKIDAVQYAVHVQELIRRKDNAAEKAAPYIHPRLSSIQANVSTDEHAKWLALMEDLDNE